MLEGLAAAVLAQGTSVPNVLDTSADAVAAAAHEVVVGKGPYLWWNEVPSQPPPGGGEFYQAVVGDKITFHYNRDNTVYLMANENDWNECDNWSDATMLGSTTLGGATPEYDGYGLVNAYSAVLLQPGVLYFSCQRGGNAFCDHCKFGQKIKVWVHEFRPPLPPPAPPTPCDQADNCKCSCCSADTCPGWPAADLVYVHLEFHAEWCPEHGVRAAPAGEGASWISHSAYVV